MARLQVVDERRAESLESDCALNARFHHVTVFGDAFLTRIDAFRLTAQLYLGDEFL